MCTRVLLSVLPVQPLDRKHTLASGRADLVWEDFLKLREGLR